MCQVNQDNSFDSWLKGMLDRTNKEEHGEVLTLCWIIWQARNQVVWNQKRYEVNVVVFTTKQYLAECSKAQVNSTKALYRDINQGDVTISWVKPRKDEVKITVDAAIFTEYSKYGIGLLARDDKGEVLQGRSEVYDGAVRPEIAEAIAVKEALSWVQGSHWPKVVEETDCLTVLFKLFEVR